MAIWSQVSLICESQGTGLLNNEPAQNAYDKACICEPYAIKASKMLEEGSPVRTKKPPQQKKPAKKELKGNVPTRSM